MTKKDFELIALAIKELNSKLGRDYLQAQTKDEVNRVAYAMTGVNLTAEHIASALATTNERYDRERFLMACGVVSSTAVEL